MNTGSFCLSSELQTQTTHMLATGAIMAVIMQPLQQSSLSCTNLAHVTYTSRTHADAGLDAAGVDANVDVAATLIPRCWCGWCDKDVVLMSQGIPETTRLHFVELAAPPNKQSREGRKGSLAKAQALSKAYSSLTGVLLALKQQQHCKQDQHVSRYICWPVHLVGTQSHSPLPQ